jgi:hypothetical protein
MKTFWLLLILAGSVCAEPAAVQQAIQEGLPAEPLRTLISEAQAKQVTAADLDGALQRRLMSLREAKAMLMETGYGRCPLAQQQELMATVGRALESKVPADALRSALKAGGGTQTMRIQSVVDAGESLKLLGLDDATVGTLMQDFVARNLGRGEILRAVQFASQQHRAGVAGPKIRELLWSDTTTSQPRGRGNGSPHGKGRGRR